MNSHSLYISFRKCFTEPLPVFPVLYSSLLILTDSASSFLLCMINLLSVNSFVFIRYSDGTFFIVFLYRSTKTLRGIQQVSDYQQSLIHYVLQYTRNVRIPPCSLLPHPQNREQVEISLTEKPFLLHPQPQTVLASNQ